MANATEIITNLTNISAITAEVNKPEHLLGTILDPFWIISSLLIIAITYGIVWILDFTIRFLSEQLGTKRHILAMVIPVFKIIVYVIALILILSPLWELGIGELAVLSGLLGAGLGLGLKDLFADIVAGFVIIIEKPYQIGDKIRIGDIYGEVKDIGLVQTIVTTPGDDRVAIPNYSVLSNAVSSANAGNAEMMVITELYISYRADISEAVRLLTEAVTTSRYVYVSPSRPYTILIENHPYYRKLIAKAYVNDLRHEFIFRSDITRQAWDAFQEAGITPPDILPPGFAGAARMERP